MRAHVAGIFEGLDVPHPQQAVAVGGSATSLRRLVGAVLEHETLERAVRVLSSFEVSMRSRAASSSTPSACACCPPGSCCSRGCSDRLGQPLQIGKGGLREGVILELLAGRDIARAA